MRRVKAIVAAAFSVALLASAMAGPAMARADSGNLKIQVVPFEFDPTHSGIVASGWQKHLGLPDSKSNANFGLLLSKNGKTPTNASAGARVLGVSGITLTDLGYDIRMGGHCGAGAPRFNVVTTDGVTHFVGCSSPPGTVEPAPPTADGLTPNTGWTRLHWTAAQLATAFPPITASMKVRSISIVFDEGVDTGPDFSGMAVLDNIRVNEAFAGKPGTSDESDNKSEKKSDKKSGKDD